MLDQVNAFKAYYESAGDDYVLVKAFFDNQMVELKKAVDVAKDLYDAANKAAADYFTATLQPLEKKL